MSGVLEGVARFISSGDAGAEVLPWHRLEYPHVQALRLYLVEHYSPSHANKVLAAIRGVLKETWRLGLLSRDEFERAVDVPRVRGESLPRGRSLSESEVGALLDACRRDGDAAGRRDRALLAIAYGAGLRRAELVALDVEDIDLDSGTLVVRSGKGRKNRVVYLPDGALEAVRDWLVVRDPELGPLFTRIRKGGRLSGERLTSQAVYLILRKRAEQAGVGGISPHDLRRTCASRLLERGVDVGVVQKVLGHADVSTTLRYDRRGDEALRRAAESLTLHDRIECSARAL